MHAVLMLVVSLVRHAVSILQMGRIRLPAECHSDVTPAALPTGKTGIDKKEATLPTASCLARRAHLCCTPRRHSHTCPSARSSEVLGKSAKTIWLVCRLLYRLVYRFMYRPLVVVPVSGMAA
jgi:hypothetical protein